MASLKAQLGQLRTKIEKLKKDYDQFFLGVLKTEPLKLRTEVENLIRKLSRIRIINTADKFLFDSLSASYSTYSTLWNRKLNEILDASRTTAKKKTPENSVTKKGKTESPKSDYVKRVVDKYIEAHQKAGINTEKLNREKITKTLESTIEKVKTKYQARDIRVKIKIAEGKVKLSVTPVK